MLIDNKAQIFSIYAEGESLNLDLINLPIFPSRVVIIN